jgi:hypothetical protein
VTELIDVHLIGLPLRLQEQAVEHFEELAREFTHLAAGQDGPHQDVPERLLALQAALDQRFAGFTQPARPGSFLLTLQTPPGPLAYRRCCWASSPNS